MNNDYKGKILISTPDIAGDIFSRSVILIVDHDENGAFGFILNKKNEVISHHLLEMFGFEVEVYEGGPVETDKIFFLIKGEPVTEQFLNISDGYYLTEDMAAVVASVVDATLDISSLKVLSGYSGWVAGQLEAEISVKTWTVVEVYNLDYTSSNDQTLWKNIMQNLGGEFLLWANAPDDVSMN